MDKYSFIDYYEILEVHNLASREVIEKAYRVLAAKYHPDKAPENEKEIFNEKMLRINEAKEILLTSDKRNEYDQLWKQHQIDLMNEQYDIPVSQSIVDNVPPIMETQPEEELWSSFGISINNKYPGELLLNNRTGTYVIHNSSKNCSWAITNEHLDHLVRNNELFFADNIVQTCSICGLQFHANYKDCPECNSSRLQRFARRKKTINWTENPIDLSQFNIK